MEPLIQSLVGLRWQDIVDILFKSYILFRLYVLFRGTNVIRMVIAIAMLWILERMALSLGLIVTSWAMQGIIATAALIIIIVFRNEIAGVLQARSFRSFFWGIPQRQIQTPIEIIVESVYELARHKLGALIVLPLKKGIESMVHGGVPWQGKLSQEMLLSIFWHGTPVHDGATVIQGNRIVEVAAILPLSKSNELPSHFGTRHRAAFGLAEKTDALVIVVSEERGEVTVFKDRAINIIKGSIVLPPGIVLKQVEPQILEVNLDVPDQKKLPIQPDWSGKLPDGLILQDARIIPDMAKVTGGSQALKNIQTIFTEKIPLENITTDGKISVGLVLLPSYLKLDEESQNHVEVIYKIARRPPPSDDDNK